MYWLRGTIGPPSTDLLYAVVICTNFSLAARVPYGPWKPQLPPRIAMPPSRLARSPECLARFLSK
jgi:hypothetical protein